MATVLMDVEEEGDKRVSVQLCSEEGESLGAPFDLPQTTTKKQLETLVNKLLDNEEAIPCTFYVEGSEVVKQLADTLEQLNRDKPGGDGVSTEKLLEVVYQPQAVFRVKPVSRCSSTIPGHGEAVTCLSFSPDGRALASGSGDTTVRFWDVDTETPQFTCKGHTHWILALAWSPDGKYVASACKNGEIRIWDPSTGTQTPKGLLKGHKKWVTALYWEPMHLWPEPGPGTSATTASCIRRIASASKDGDIRIWDAVLGRCERVLAGHTGGVTALRWTGEGVIVSASQDRTLKVWRPEDGVLCRTLEGHGHWVNTMALNTDYAMRIAAFDPAEASKGTNQTVAEIPPAEMVARARKRYLEAKGADSERLVSGSDDFTMFLWRPSEDKKPMARLTGHQQLINHVCFSPDGRWIASASFDKSVKLWNGRDGKFVTSFRGHVQAVYQISWSADSRMLVSGSADSTLKLWEMRVKKLGGDLPGHADEVYAVDWSPDGERVASGGKDKVLKMWRY